MRRSGTGFRYLLLALVAISADFSLAQSTAALSSNARARLLRDIEMSQPSSLDAISASVGEALDRRVEADVQPVIADPSLKGGSTSEPDTRGESSSLSPEDDWVRFREKMPAATAWSPLQAAGLESQPDLVSPNRFEHQTFPIAGPGAATADAGKDTLPDAGINSVPQTRPSRAQVEQQQQREKRQVRELQKKSEQQCGQLRSGQLECRLKLRKTNVVRSTHSAAQLPGQR